MSIEKREPGVRRVLSRRTFLKLAALSALAGCVPQTPAPSPAPVTDTPPPSTDTPVPPTATPPPTWTPAATPTAAPPSPKPTATVTSTLRRAEVMRHAPEAQSRVVQVRDAAVWDAEALVPAELRRMLDAALVALTGLDDAATAWATLFSPQERVAIKVNAIGSSGYWTHPPLVSAVVAALHEAGLPPEQVVIFDRESDELRGAGYSLAREGAGARCYGTDGELAPGWQLMGTDVRLSDILLQCDALINIPILKQHGMAGISFAMKNHYGTFDKPWQFHRGEAIARGMAELNALPPIRERTRLIIGDALAVVASGWRRAIPGDALLMSFDPVAHDAVGLSLYDTVMSAEGQSTAAAWDLATPWLEQGTALEIGTHALDAIDLVTLDLAAG